METGEEARAGAAAVQYDGAAPVIARPGNCLGAFKTLTGSHGGLGGWQNRPLLVYPAQWSAEADLVGADAVHDQLLAWRDMLGHDRPAADPAKPAAADPVGG